MGLSFLTPALFTFLNVVLALFAAYDVGSISPIGLFFFNFTFYFTVRSRVEELCGTDFVKMALFIRRLYLVLISGDLLAGGLPWWFEVTLAWVCLCEHLIHLEITAFFRRSLNARFRLPVAGTIKNPMYD